MIELGHYVQLMDFFEELEAQGPHGAGEVAVKWTETILNLDSEDERYVLRGIDRLAGHPDGWGWEEEETRSDLDPLVWTFHRAWVDRYGRVHSSREFLNSRRDAES